MRRQRNALIRNLQLEEEALSVHIQTCLTPLTRARTKQASTSTPIERATPQPQARREFHKGRLNKSNVSQPSSFFALVCAGHQDWITPPQRLSTHDSNSVSFSKTLRKRGTLQIRRISSPLVSTFLLRDRTLHKAAAGARREPQHATGLRHKVGIEVSWPQSNLRPCEDMKLDRRTKLTHQQKRPHTHKCCVFVPFQRIA